MAVNNLIQFSTETPHQAAGLVLAIAKTGNAKAQAQLAQMLLDGNGIKKDHVLALQWFSIAAKNGYLQAINMLGRCYENGWGCTINYTKAAQYYQLAAEKGLNWGMYNFANLLIKGKGITKDLSKAFDLYYQAAQTGHAKSMNLVGRFYEEGWLVATDLDKAINWYRRSASAGDFRGQCSYASVLTAQGKVDEAVIWLRQSMQTATHGFLQKMARALWQSPHKPLQEMAIEMFARCAEEGDLSDQQAYQDILQRQSTQTKENLYATSYS
ncbi:sel1 repeat family protein [Entomomonas sp. E2T0]|uniref:tetratricopeptide repeat protein n=1 Tax=Entomomonas sp. E2T0 TaxID=2930213 RepID=UPI0022283AA0|nr:tetratricopeptide repeat protein [Entomomonas sp. E2T0]UYZ84854.1 sel1 repeat family protein [Entomomonas sp. E2T0]